MSEKMVVGAFLTLYVFCSAWVIHQELQNQKQERINALVLQEISDLKKQTRINAQDVDFLEKLVIEGKK